MVEAEAHGVRLGVGQVLDVVQGQQPHPGIEITREVAASIQPQLTSQEEGKLSRPIALFVRTRSSTPAWERCSTSRNWLWPEPAMPRM